jgi:hypothetical protein
MHPTRTKRIEEAAQLWSEGLSVIQISARLGIPLGTVCSTASRHRDLFPARMSMHRMIAKASPAATESPVEPRRTFFDGRYIEHVNRELPNGAVVTMPKVSFIDEVRDGG